MKPVENIENLDIAVIDEDNNWCFVINIDLSKNSIPYFIIYDNKDIDKATKVATISLIEPKYIDIERPLNKWILSEYEKEILVNILNKPNIFCDYDNNYQTLVNTYNDYCMAHIDINNKGYYNRNSKRKLNCIKPNYKELK